MEYKPKEPLHRPVDVAWLGELAGRSHDLIELLELVSTELPTLDWEAERLQRLAQAAERLARVVQAEAIAKRSRSAGLERARKTLEAITSSWGPTLDYLEVQGWQAWSVPTDLPADRLEELVTTLATLRDALEAYEAHRTTRPATRTERQTLLQELQQREQAIAELVSAVAPLLSPADVTPEPTGPPGPEEAEPSVPDEEAAADGGSLSDDSPSPSPTATAPEPSTLAVEERPPAWAAPAPSAFAISDSVLPPRPPLEVETGRSRDGEASLPTTVPPPPAALRESDGDIDLFAALLERGDLAGAFWLARIREQSGISGLPPSWLMQAAHLASHVLRETREVAEAWYEAAHGQPTAWQEAKGVCDPRVAGLLVTAAALEPALVAPETGAVSWLQDAHRGISDALQPHLASILEVASRGQRIHPIERDWHRALAEAREQARHWIDRTRQASPPLRSAFQVLRHLASRESEAGEVAWWIAENRLDRAETVHSRLVRFRDAALLEEMIDSALARHRGAVRKKDLEGSFRNLVRNRIRSLAEVAEAWLEAMEPGSAVTSGASDGSVASRLASTLEEMLETLSALATNAEVASEHLLKASADVLAAAAERLRGYLLGGTPRVALSSVPWQLEIQRPLLAIVPCPIDEPHSVPAVLELRHHPTLREVLARPVQLDVAFEDQLGAGDLLACHRLLELMEAESADYLSAAIERFNVARSALSEAVQSRIDAMQARVEKETIDHVLPEGLRAQFLARLQGMRDRVASLEPRYLRRAALERELDEIDRVLEESRQNRIRSLKERIVRMERERARTTEPGPGDELTISRYLELARDALEGGDIPLADEYVTLAEHPDDHPPPSPKQAPLWEQYLGYVERFKSLHPQLEKQFDGVMLSTLAQRLGKGADLSTISTRGLPSGTLKEVQAGLEAYVTLKYVMGRGGTGLSDALDHLRNLLAYMGFTPPQLREGPAGPPGYVAFQATMDGGLSPLPEFGSDRDSRYYVVLVGGRPGVERMAQTITSMGLARECPIILYFGRLTELQRAEWADYCRKNRLTALLVDELMLFFVAGERGVRLRPLILLSMAWGYANPFTPFAAGTVPRELFKGRSQIVDHLLDPSQSGVIYGGRQLGKSAILRAVEREVERRRKELGVQAYVCYLDIRALGSRDVSLSRRPDALWGMLRNWLHSTRLLQSPPDDPVALRTRLVERFKRDKSLQIYLLLDEADNFLEADGAADFPILTELKALSDETGRRFKVVLCGLHSVQRYSLLPNQPLAHVGRAMVVGPLDPKAAIELVREPLFTLGFRFEDETPLYRIFCYTNYHPALIQHFCRELVEHLMARRSSHSPTHVITVKDVEQVYQRAEVRQVIRERFEWTIALDERYQALVYAITLDQLWEDGYRKEYAAAEVHALARDVWPAAFDPMGTDEVRTLLDELVGLGVLVKSPTGRYRLRNGNVVRALGSPEEIWERVERFTEAGPPSPRYAPGETHEILRRETGEFSPLTLQQEKVLNNPDSGAYLVMASEALGLSRIWSALQRLESAEGESAKGFTIRFVRLPSEVVSADAVEHYMGALSRQVRRGRVVAVADLGMLHPEAGLSPLIARLSESVARLGSRDRTVKLLLQMDPQTIQRWYREPDEMRAQAEGSVGEVLAPPLFSEGSLRRYLSHLGTMATPEVVRAVLQATGGWPWLLLRLVEPLARRTRGHFDNADPRPEASLVLSGTDPRGPGQLVEPFLEALGLHAIAQGMAVIKAVHALAPVPPEELSPELVEAEAVLTAPELRATLATLEALRILARGPRGVTVEPVVARVLGLT